MQQGQITMSFKELDRLPIIKACVDKKLSQKEAALRMDCSLRQVGRLIKVYRKKGPIGLISKHRGKVSNNKISASVQDTALALIRKHYGDFGPTFAREKLTEIHGLKLSTETLRQWMIQANLWTPKAQKAARIHQRRSRRSCLGELVQIDGSPHDWFEGRASKCTLIVFIDDATSRLMALHFSPSETTEAYMKTLSTYLGIHGRPSVLYSDRHSVFRVNHPGKAEQETQFGRALRMLDIQGIPANSPQAKGRVERANKTLQNRLIKEMRLAHISSIDEANQFLPTFMEDYNRRFSIDPRSSENAHREVLHSPEELQSILSIQAFRKLSKDLTFQFKNKEYQLTGYGKGYRLRQAIVQVCKSFGGEVTAFYQGQNLAFRVFEPDQEPQPIADAKTIHGLVDEARNKQKIRENWKSPSHHPWRRYLPKTEQISSSLRIN